jgi:cell division transport system permease protein
MDKDATCVALDDSKRKLAAAILRPGQTESGQREMAKESHLSYLLGATLRALRRGGAAAVATVLLAALAALVTAGTVAGRLALVRATAPWRAELRVVAILRAAVPRPEAPDSVVAAARALRGAAAVRYVGPAEALAEVRRLLGPRGEGLERLPSNPVPARLEVTPRVDLDAAGVRGLVGALDRLPGVDEVRAAADWLEPLERLERGLRFGGLALGATLALAAIVTAAGATAAARREGAEETAILRLAGIPAGRLFLPLVLQALALGTLGALAGVALFHLGSETGARWTGPWLRAALGLDPLPGLPRAWLAGLLGGGATLGLLGALAASRG